MGTISRLAWRTDSKRPSMACCSAGYQERSPQGLSRRLGGRRTDALVQPGLVRSPNLGSINLAGAHPSSIGSILLLPAGAHHLPQSVSTAHPNQAVPVVREKSAYSGQAVARLLGLAMQPPDKSEEAPSSRVDLEAKVPSFNVTIAGTTIPLDFIWERVERWILGPAYTVEGIVSSSGRTIILEAWSYEGAAQWRAVSNAEPESDPLRTAIADLADQMKIEYGHYRELTDTRMDQRRYGDAIYFCKRLDKAEQGTGLGLSFLYLGAGWLDEAESTLKDVLEKSKDGHIQSQALLGLAFGRAARGRHSEAIELLRKVGQGREAQVAKLGVAQILSYRKKFTSAQKILRSVCADIEGGLERLLEAEFASLSVRALRSKLDDLDDESRQRLYIDLQDLADSYGTLGRCAEELDDPKQAEQNYGFAAAVLQRRAIFWVPYHRAAANCGIWLKDVARYDKGKYDEAIDANDRQFRDAYDYYRENPRDAAALTNMAWAVAGNVACLAAKVEIAKSELNDEVRQQVIDHAEQAAGLLRSVPEEHWHAVISEAEKHSSAGGEGEVKSRYAIKPLSREQTGEFARLVANLLRVMDPVLASTFISDIARRKQSDEKAQRYFKKLAQTGEDANAAEGLFGLACVHATCERYDQALHYLAQGIEYDEHLKNRAQVNADLKVLRGSEGYREEFVKLVQWDRTSVANAQ